MFFYFSSIIHLKALQHLNVSHNGLGYPEIYCGSSKKIIETIDLSDNRLDNLRLFRTSFFNCLTSKNLYLKNNAIEEFSAEWNFLEKSLRKLDLRHNNISKLIVSEAFLI